MRESLGAGRDEQEKEGASRLTVFPGWFGASHTATAEGGRRGAENSTSMSGWVERCGGGFRPLHLGRPVVKRQQTGMVIVRVEPTT